MKEYFCNACTRIWQAGDDPIQCCKGVDPVLFDVAEHGRRLIPGNNAWQMVFAQMREDPLWEKARTITNREGSSSAVACTRTYFKLLKGELP